MTESYKYSEGKWEIVIKLKKRIKLIMISMEAILSGIGASIILITGYSSAIGCFVRAKKLKNPFLNWAGFFLICMGSFYLGTVSSFIYLLITNGTNI
ncbi:MAG: hypothetical protein ACTSWY_00970, partial [Promethearchaeota archaeon]